MQRLSLLTLALSATVLIVAHIATAIGSGKPDGDGVPYRAAAGCPEVARDLAADLATRGPREARYPVCVDQHAVLASALAEAQATKKLLLVDFGATWCPWCRELHRQLATTDVRNGPAGERNLDTLFVTAKIGVSTLNQGRQAVIPTGRDAMNGVLAQAPAGFKALGVPLIVIIDPSNPTRIVPRNIDELEVAGEIRIDAVRLRQTLLAAHDHLRAGAPMPAEPSWISRKLKRVLSYF